MSWPWRLPGRPSPALALLALAGLLAGSAATAHEMGTLQMTTTFRRDGIYRVDVAIDEERVSGFPATGPPGETRYGRIAGFAAAVPAADRGRLGPFFQLLAEKTTLAFDGRPSPPASLALDRPPAPPDDPFAPLPKLTLHLTGPIPPGARTATWAIDLVLGSFPIGFLNEGDAAPSRQWLEGQSTSRPFTLAAAVVPPSRWQVALRAARLGFRRILPAGTAPILLVVGIALLALRLRRLLVQLAAFAGGQSVVLALAACGLAMPGPRWAGPAAGLAVVCLAIANLRGRELAPWRLALVAACGLAAGIELVPALAEMVGVGGLGAAGSHLAAAAGLGAGAGAAELAVAVAALVLLGGAASRREPWYRARVVVPASLVLAAVGLYGALQGLFG